MERALYICDASERIFDAEGSVSNASTIFRRSESPVHAKAVTYSAPSGKVGFGADDIAKKILRCLLEDSLILKREGGEKAQFSLHDADLSGDPLDNFSRADTGTRLFSFRKTECGRLNSVTYNSTIHDKYNVKNDDIQNIIEQLPYVKGRTFCQYITKCTIVFGEICVWSRVFFEPTFYTLDEIRLEQKLRTIAGKFDTPLVQVKTEDELPVW